MSIQNSLAQKGLNSKGLNVVAELGSTAAGIQGIKNKIGISILSKIAVAEELSAGRLKALTIDGLDLARKFYLTRHKDRSESPLSKAFIKFLKYSAI